jgi:hypothetical protein
MTQRGRDDIGGRYAFSVASTYTGGGTGMSTVLLEREGQLNALEGWWAEAADGDGRLVFLGGEAGVGKTALVRCFRASLSPGARQLVGAADAASGDGAHGVLLRGRGRNGAAGEMGRCAAPAQCWEAMGRKSFLGCSARSGPQG